MYFTRYPSPKKEHQKTEQKSYFYIVSITNRGGQGRFTLTKYANLCFIDEYDTTKKNVLFVIRNC